MFFTVTRDGRPLRKRRYIFSETFMIAALARLWTSAGDQEAVQEAVDLYDQVLHYWTRPVSCRPNGIPRYARCKDWRSR